MMSDSHEHKAPVRVLIVDDQQLIREGIGSLLSIQEGIEVVGTATNGQEAIEQAVALSPDIVLMDVRMPVMDGVQATAEVRRQVKCQVLMLTTFDDETYIVEALRAGASGYLLKDMPVADLAQAIRLAHAGVYPLDPAVAGKLVGALDRAEKQAEQADAGIPEGADLTEREAEVLRLIARGATNREIAKRLSISEGTVKNHVSNILSRLGLRDRTQAAIYAHERGLLRD
jgi:DNA-binding NarL/FixJ family response regulator